MDRSTQIDTLSSITQVSRETIISLKKYEYMLINANKNLCKRSMGENLL